LSAIALESSDQSRNPLRMSRSRPEEGLAKEIDLANAVVAADVRYETCDWVSRRSWFPDIDADHHTPGTGGITVLDALLFLNWRIFDRFGNGW